MPAIRFRVGGIPVVVQVSFFLAAAFLGTTHDLADLPEWVAVVFVSIVAHEMGHALMFRAFGVRSRIVLHLMGGVTIAEDSAALSPGRLSAMAVAGPGVGLALGLLTFALSRALGTPTPGGSADTVVHDVLFVNVAWSLVNLLPIHPLDGGQLLRQALGVVLPRRVEIATQAVSLLTVIGVAVVAIPRGYVVAVLILGWFWFTSAQPYWEGRRWRRDEAMRGRLATAADAVRNGAGGEAAGILRETARDARSRQVRAEAARLLVIAGLQGGMPELAAEGLGSFPRGYGAGAHLEGLVALVSGHHDEAVRLLTDAYAAQPGDERGAHLAHALFAAGRPEDALTLITGPQAEGLGPATHDAIIERLFHSRRFADAAEYGERAYARWPRPATAYNVACSWSRAGRLEDAAAWLTRAVDAGFGSLGGLESDGDLVPIHATAGYRAAVDRLRSEGRATATE